MSDVAKFRIAKAVGLTAEEAWESRKRAILASAREGKWKPSETAATLAEVSLNLRKVYGKRATEFLFRR